MFHAKSKRTLYRPARKMPGGPYTGPLIRARDLETTINVNAYPTSSCAAVLHV